MYHNESTDTGDTMTTKNPDEPTQYGEKSLQHILRTERTLGGPKPHEKLRLEHYDVTDWQSPTPYVEGAMVIYDGTLMANEIYLSDCQPFSRPPLKTKTTYKRRLGRNQPLDGRRYDKDLTWDYLPSLKKMEQISNQSTLSPPRRTEKASENIRQSVEHGNYTVTGLMEKEIISTNEESKFEGLNKGNNHTFYLVGDYETESKHLLKEAENVEQIGSLKAKNIAQGAKNVHLHGRSQLIGNQLEASSAIGDSAEQCIFDNPLAPYIGSRSKDTVINRPTAKKIANFSKNTTVNNPKAYPNPHPARHNRILTDIGLQSEDITVNFHSDQPFEHAIGSKRICKRAENPTINYDCERRQKK